MDCYVVILLIFFCIRKLLEKVRPRITKQTINMRQPISIEEKLAVILRYLATEETCLIYQYRIHSTTITKFIQLLCQMF